MQNGGGSGGDGSSSGLSSKSKKIIGGVVGGRGGAILIGAIAIVLLRVRGRQNKQKVNEDDIIFAGQNDNLMREKNATPLNPQAAVANAPFRNNLEQYHNPNGAVNTASNF